MLMNGFVSIKPSENLINFEWLSSDTNPELALGHFEVIIPLSMILDFAEDYRHCKTLVNTKKIEY